MDKIREQEVYHLTKVLEEEYCKLDIEANMCKRDNLDPVVFERLVQMGYLTMYYSGIFRGVTIGKLGLEEIKEFIKTGKTKEEREKKTGLKKILQDKSNLREVLIGIITGIAVLVIAKFLKLG